MNMVYTRDSRGRPIMGAPTARELPRVKIRRATSPTGDEPPSGAPAPIQSREPGAAKQHLNPNGGDVRSNPSASSRHLPY